MRAAQWPLALFLLLISGLVVSHLLFLGPEGAQDPARPDRGTLAPLLEPPPRRLEVARLEGEDGPVVDLAADARSVAVLTSEGWFLFSPESGQSWIGVDDPGSPNWMVRPAAIALGSREERVFVLDGGRSIIAVWDSAGSRLPDLAIPAGNTYARRPTQLLLGPLGRPLVTVQRVDLDGTGFWEVHEYDAAGVPHLSLSLPSRSRHMVFQEPLLARRDTTLFSLTPLSHELARVELDQGRAVTLAFRPDPPLWYIPRRHRRDYRRLLRGLGGAAATVAELPEFWPSVRGLTFRADGSILVTVTAGEDRQHVELLSGALQPIGRFARDGFQDPVFLSKGRAFLAEEGMDETVIYELVLENR